jgi:hypothetical protein
MRIACLCLLSVAMSLPALAGRGDSKEDPKAINGAWKPTAAELGGKGFPDKVLKAMTLIVPMAASYGFSGSNTGMPSATATDNSCLSDETS